jgi:hypothetical protein
MPGTGEDLTSIYRELAKTPEPFHNVGLAWGFHLTFDDLMRFSDGFISKDRHS